MVWRIKLSFRVGCALGWCAISTPKMLAKCLSLTSMFGKSYSNIAVESDSVCSLIASNFEPLYGSLNRNFTMDVITIDTATVDKLAQNSIPTNFNFSLLANRSSFVFDVNKKFEDINYNFEGTIPTEIGSMASLKEVNLARNKLEGTLPTEIGNLELLTNLVLDNNQLTGSIPSEVLSLLDMTTLVLGEFCCNFNQYE
jgi:hypothetical protein